MTHSKDPELFFKEVTMNDAAVLFEWRNDAESRLHSRSTEPITWEDHVRWLGATLHGQAPERIIRIVMTARGEQLGVVRADRGADGYCEISYTVAPRWRGQGIGKRMVVTFVEELLPGEKISAIVEQGHIPSERIAEALGLQPQEKEHVDGRTFVTWRSMITSGADSAAIVP